MEHVFVADTNLFLECKRLEDIPWSELGVDPVVVLLTKPVLGEIDKHKKSSGRTRKRALAISGRIRGMLKSDVAEETVRAASPQVTLRLAPVVRPDADLGEILDYSSNDDRVVGIASALAKRDGTELVQFLTDDSVAASTAHSVGVPFRFIDEGWKRPPERTAEAKRAEELEEELDGYRSQEPRIVLGNATAEAVATRLVRRVPLPLGRAEVDALIDRLRVRHPLQLELPVPEAEERDDGTKVTYRPPDPEEVEKYRTEEYPGWVSKCRSTLQKLHESGVEMESAPKLAWALANEGARPAVQMRVTFAAEGRIWFRRLSTQDREEDDGNGAKVEPDSGSLPRLPRPPRPPQVQRIVDTSGVVLKGSDTAAAGIRLNDLRMGDMGRIAGAATALSDLARVGAALTRDQERWRSVIGSLGEPAVPAVVPTLDIGPAFKPFVPPKHDKEAFYYDEWPPDKPVRRGALTCDLYRHRNAEMEFEVEVVFPPDGDVGGAVLCTVHAENLTAPVSLRIAVSRSIEEYSLLERARALVDSCGGRH